jgi:ribonuclease HII
LLPTLEREAALWAKGLRFVAGVDEVGRGPLAGPVVAAAVVLAPGGTPLEGVRDSKLLTAAARLRLEDVVRRGAMAVGLGAASVREIDRLNIRKATALAMRRALGRLPHRPEHILLDGTPLPELGFDHESIVDGDACCQSIAAASIVAKCVRDRLMGRLALRYPIFCWDTNKGYATEQHLTALVGSGPSPHHRLSFSPLVQPRLF